jgi:arabinose-5-phosphate isomerase
MHKGDAIPRVSEDALLRDALVEMTRKGLGMTAIVDASNTLVGIYTDGDLRRTLDLGIDVHDAKICDLMTREFVTVKGGILAEEALLTMQEKKINGLLVVDDNRQLLGALNMHDLLRAGVV